MATSVVPAENAIHGFSTMTHVVSARTGHYGQDTEASTRGRVGKLLKGDPQALGVVQIMVGIITLMLGLVSTICVPSVLGYSSVTIWAAVFYMISGSLSVGASMSSYGCLVKGSLVMNVFSAVAAGVATIVLSCGIILIRNEFYSKEAVGMLTGINVILLVFSVFEFIISICTSAYACCFTCKDSCCCDPVEFVHAQPVTTF